MRRATHLRWAASAVVVAWALAAHIGDPGSAASVKDGGVARVLLRTEDVDSLDPAIAYATAAWTLLDTTCALLLRREGSGLAPEVAAGPPRVSRDRKTYTFTLRDGFRFSDGTPVRASAFRRAIDRTLAPGVKSPWAEYTRDIVGAPAVLSGRAPTAAGVVARGRTLVIRLRRPVPEFPERTTFLCAVPPGLPADREGIGVFPAAGPYHVAEHRPADSVVIRRNPYYRGRRAHHVDGFSVDLRAGSFDEILDRVERGDVDWGWALPEAYFDPRRRLAARYGVNRSRFFVHPGTGFMGFVFNTSRPLFRGNPRLRRAVNFAIDRAAIQRASGGTLQSRLTDQYLLPGMPGFRDANIYPLHGPDLRKARELARGNTRGGEAVLFTVASPLRLAAAQLIKRDLAKIGLDVEIRGIPLSAYFGRLGAEGAYDIGFRPWVLDFDDPYSMLNVNLDGRFIGTTNWGRFDSPTVNRLLRRAAGLDGLARYRAYAQLDAQLARDEAPMLAVEASNDAVLVSARVGCVGPSFDLTAICLR
jgi:peptide/nickel transport system substrate-binding protein